MYKSICYYRNVLLSFLRNSLMLCIEYRANFLISLLFNTVWTIVQIMLISIIFYNVSLINGWSKYEVMLFFGIDEVIFPLFVSLGLTSLNRVEEHVIHGTMDYILLKPINTQFFVSLRHIDLFQITPIFFGISIIIFCSSKLNLHVSLTKLLLVILLIAIGVWIMYSIYLICISLTFKYLKVSFLRNIVLAFVGCMIYPLDIYKGIFKLIITVIIPVGIIVDFPTRVLVKHLSMYSLLYELIIAAVFGFISTIMWRRGIRKYTSASS